MGFFVGERAKREVVMGSLGRFATGLSVAVVSVVIGSSAAAAAAAAAVTHSFSQGRSVVAEFIETSGCIETVTSVFASDSITEPQATAAQRELVVVLITRANRCVPELLIEGAGEADVHELQVSPSLGTAHLVASVEFQNFVSGTTFPVQVDLTFAASSRKVTSSEVSTQLEKDEDQFSFVFRAMGMSRNALVHGSVSGGLDLFASAASTPVQSSIQSFRNAELLVVRS